VGRVWRDPATWLSGVAAAGGQRVKLRANVMAEGWLAGGRSGEGLTIEAGGAWTLPALVRLDAAARVLLTPAHSGDGQARINLEGLEALDTAGAWLLHRLERDLERLGWQVELEGLRDSHTALLTEIRRVEPRSPPPAVVVNPYLRLLANLGRNTLAVCAEAARLLSFYGQTVLTLGRLLLQPGRLRLTSLTHHLEQTCINALPIVGLIAFLIGVVMAYQGADQLRRFGAEIFTVNLLGISILREIGILLTAIVVAGRSGSAFTAQIGTMKVNQEIDAMRTLGLDPVEVLVLPRLLALMIALPLLAFFADVLGLFGGGLMCALTLDISPGQYLTQLDRAIDGGTFLVGLIKAPVFAFLIGMVGCYEGLSVAGSAESVGQMTTRSVVVAIFLVIVFDALFSILFSYVGL
jgi:phospholipid/cholesterol/gamma-HCH transport system permease protein